MTPDAIDSAAKIIADNRVNRTRLDTLDAGIRPGDLHDAYAVQERYNRILSDQGLGTRAGYKIGCTTPVMQEYMNIHEPAFGEVFASTVHRNHAELGFRGLCRTRRRGGDCGHARRGPCRPDGAAYDRDSVRDAIGATMISIELVDARYRDYRELDTPTMAADNFFNAAVVLGRSRRGLAGARPWPARKRLFA